MKNCLPDEIFEVTRYACDKSVFVTYWMSRKIERCLYRLVSPNGKHLLMIYSPISKYFSRPTIFWKFAWLLK